ncbi:hypothetical protein T265_04231 [Opisthorchis viverrini]|uniref:Uncharacterized protein n=1 Tax=Opisthorchis viverrini TaxID=6198 RepID=A0A074ZNS3_OPIVI|nr:hypothetical protein T265_04231 [Opisthorchis viverrini]KER29043.1 hypothetical protein T265_04231 [Opisthorchis viverrini]
MYFTRTLSSSDGTSNHSSEYFHQPQKKRNSEWYGEIDNNSLTTDYRFCFWILSFILNQLLYINQTGMDGSAWEKQGAKARSINFIQMTIYSPPLPLLYQL